MGMTYYVKDQVTYGKYVSNEIESEIVWRLTSVRRHNY